MMRRLLFFWLKSECRGPVSSCQQIRKANKISKNNSKIQTTKQLNHFLSHSSTFLQYKITTLFQLFNIQQNNTTSLQTQRRIIFKK